MTLTKTIAVTGANGFLGRYLVEAFVSAGHPVIALCRQPESGTAPHGVTYRHFSLEGTKPCDLGDADVVVHCAHDLATRPGKLSVNIEGSRKLIRASRDCGASVVYISSLVASAEGYSRYARDKDAVERILDPARDLIIRPGLVLGDGGLAGRMISALKRSPFVPVFFGGRQPIYPVEIGDLARATVQLVVSERAGTYVLASQKPTTMCELYRWAGARAGTRPRFIPLPFSATLFLVRLLERCGLELSVTSESLAGIRNLRVTEIPRYSEIDIDFAPLSVGTDSRS